MNEANGDAGLDVLDEAAFIPVAFNPANGINLDQMALNPAYADAVMAFHEPFGQALLDACQYGTVEEVGAVLDEGVDVNHIGFKPLNGLMHAAKRGNKPIVVLMLDRGAEVNGLGRFETTALHQASRGGHLDVVEVLHALGADVEHAEDIYGCRALHRAAKRDHLPVCEFLVSKGADLMAVCENGHNPLQVYGSEATPPLSPETKALRCAALEAVWAMGPHPSQILLRLPDERWARRGPLVWVLAEHAYRPLQHRALAIALAAASLDPAAPITSVALTTKEQRHAFLLGRVFSNEGIVRLLAALL